MAKYELTIVLKAKAKSKKKSVTEKLEKLVAATKGKLGKPEDWGEKGDRFFLHFPLELGEESAKELNNKLRVEEDIVKFLLIRNG